MLLVGWAVAAAAAVEVAVDWSVRLRIGGVSRLDRAVYFNLHSSPSPGEWPPADIAYAAGNLSAHLGRAFSVSARMATSREDPERPGYADLAKLAADCARYPPALGGWPAAQTDIIQSAKTEQYYAGAKGFVPGSHDAAAEFWSAYVTHCAPEWQSRYLCEVANECNVHVGEVNTTWDEVIALHVAIADRLHKDHNTTVLIGGPTIAYPEYQLHGFENWREQSMGKFIEAAGDHVDHLSLHLYDTYLQNFEKDPADYTPRSGNNVDAILDLNEAASLLRTGRVLPQVVSEYGSGFKVKVMNYTDLHEWYVLRGVNSKLMQLLDRPDRVLKAVPFIVDKATWYKDDMNGTQPYPWVFWRRTPSNPTAYELTSLHKWYRLWEGVSGDRALSASACADVQAAAYVDAEGGRSYLALNNMRTSAVTVDLKMEMAGGVSVRRLRYSNRSVVYEEHGLGAAPSSLQLEAEEAVVVVGAGRAAAADAAEVTMHANQTLVAVTGAKQLFHVSGPPLAAAPRSARLRFGFGGPSGSLSPAPALAVDGAAALVQPDRQMAGRVHVSSNTGEMFGSVSVPLDPATLQTDAGSHTVELTFARAGGTVSSVVLVVVQ